jgi:hypothetical protein
MEIGHFFKKSILVVLATLLSTVASEALEYSTKANLKG